MLDTDWLSGCDHVLRKVSDEDQRRRRNNVTLEKGEVASSKSLRYLR